MEIPEINNLDIGVRNIDVNQINIQPVNDWLIRKSANGASNLSTCNKCGWNTYC